MTNLVSAYHNRKFVCPTCYKEKTLYTVSMRFTNGYDIEYRYTSIQCMMCFHTTTNRIQKEYRMAGISVSFQRRQVLVASEIPDAAPQYYMEQI